MQVPGKLQYNTFSALFLLRGAEKNKRRTAYLCLQLRIKAILGKKMGFFCTNYNLLLTLVYSLNTTYHDVDLSVAAPSAPKVHASCQGLLLRTAPEWKKPTGLSELVSLHSTGISCWMTQGQKASLSNSPPQFTLFTHQVVLAFWTALASSLWDKAASNGVSPELLADTRSQG